MTFHHRALLAAFASLLLLNQASALPPPIRIMPLGDSITYGVGAAGGYRTPLYRLLTNLNYNVDFVGTQTTNPDTNLPDLDHEGHSGWTIGGLDGGILGWLDSIADPDVILLHIGTNDSGAADFSNRVDRLDAFVTKMSLYRPYAHIIVTSVMKRSDLVRYAAITNLFNPYIPGKIAAQQALGRRVTFLDMHAYLELTDMGDGLHPNQVGYNKMATNWLISVTNVIKQTGDWDPPNLYRAVGSTNRTQVAVTFSKAVTPASATNKANYALSGGLAISGVTLSADQRTVTLTTSTQGKGSNYVVTVNNVTDLSTPTPLTVAANSTASFTAITQRGYLNNIPESSAYSLVYSLDIPVSADYKTNAVAYSADNSALFSSTFRRVAYYMELQGATGDLQYVWASMDAFTNNAAALGVPTVASGVIFQKSVTNLTVQSNVAGVSNGSGLTGNLEFWPSNYSAPNFAGVPGASATVYDFGDQRDPGTYGCMQVHNTTAGQTLFAFNNWGGSGGTACVGIGNCPAPVNGGVDWTFAQNAGNYTVRSLQVLVLTTPVIPTTPPPPIRIMPLGDSITYGSPIPGGYRNPLYHALTNLGYAVNFIGTQNGNATNALPEIYHEGHGGWKISDPSIGLYENILGWFGAIADPDVILLHIGTNDSGGGTTFTNAIERLDALITRMAVAKPNAHIIVTSLMKRTGSNYAAITNYFNPFVPGKCAAQAALGRRVTFLDMHAYLELTDMSDGLHPNAGGYVKMANAWVPAITNVISPSGELGAPTLVYAVGSTNNLQVSVTFNKPVTPFSATNVANYALSGGLTVSNAQISADMRTVTLSTGLQTGGTNYTVTINNVVDFTSPTPLAVASGSTVSFVAAKPRGYLNYVAESPAYTLAYSLNLPTSADYKNNLVPLAADNSALIGSSFSRVAYYLELVKLDGTFQYVWASMNAFTNNVATLGLPTLLSGAVFQKSVTGLTVDSNVAGVTLGSNYVGNLEFWPSSYDATNSAGVSGASNTTLDFGDRPIAGNYGCMQMHNTTLGKTLFAINNWGGNGNTANTLDIGIGNQPSGSPDWTAAANASTYTVRTLQVLVLAAADSIPPTLVSAQAGFARTLITVTFSEPLDASSIDASRFALNNGVSVVSASLRGDKRTVDMITSLQPAGVPLTLTVTGVRDVAANLIAPGSTIAVADVSVLPPEVTANAGTLANGYRLVYTLDIPVRGNFNSVSNFYTLNQSSATNAFDRVAYYLELQKSDGTVQYLWASMDAFTPSLSKIGVPTTASKALFQQSVNKLDVKSNVAGITSGTNMAGGYLEFWPSSYSATNAAGVAGASNTTYDFGDSFGTTSAGYGSMQVHNAGALQTLFGLNNWGGDNNVLDLGIGNCPSPVNSGVDWTFSVNAATYPRRTLHVLVRPGTLVIQTPPPAIRIMPLGDSITYGQPIPGGYRFPLYTALTNAGYNVNYVGTQSGNATNLLSEVYHEGHSGWKISDPSIGLYENILGWFGAIADPDVILLHIGTNDDNGSTTFTNAVERLDALITRMAVAKPNAHIIVTTLLKRSSNYAAITNYFNPFVPSRCAAQAALGRRVTFLDMHACLELTDLVDGVHPNAGGYAKMAAAWLPAITNAISAVGEWGRPTLMTALGSGDFRHVSVTFNKPVSSISATSIANYAISGGVSVSDASLSADMRTVTLTTSLQASRTNYVLTVSNVTDITAPTPLSIAPGSSVTFTGASPRGYTNNVPESAGYSLVYSMDIPTAPDYKNNAVSNAVDNSAQIGPWFDRVAYFAELQETNGALYYLWASMDAFTNNAAALGVPTLASGVVLQKQVSNLNVVCNMPGVTTGSGFTGNLEFWPSNYDAVNSAGVPGASDTLFDVGDRPTAGNYGCMQIHNTTAKQTLFAFNNWGGNGGNACLGIGNCPTPINGGVDWTYTQNAGNFTVKSLQVLVRRSAGIDNTPPTPLSARAGISGSLVTVVFSEPLAPDSVTGNRFSLNNGVEVLGATLFSDQRTVSLATSPQPAGTALTLTISGVRDASPSANAVPNGTTIAVTLPAPPPEVVSTVGTLANGYQLIYTLDIPTKGNFNASANFYRVDQRAAQCTFDRIAYYAELKKADNTVQYLWVSMDAFTNNLSAIGVPTAASKAVYQQYVSNLDVLSNVAGITNGTAMAGGNLEFWPTDYGASNAMSVAGASDAALDFGDSRTLTGSHGSMQIHNSTYGQVLFAMNNWGADGQPIALGIGNRPGQSNTDWTFAANAGTYVSRTLHVLVRLSVTNGLPAEVAAKIPLAANYQLAYSINLPVQGSFNTNSPAYYAVNNVTNGFPSFSRIAYYLELQKSGTPVITQYIWTAMDAFTTDARKIAVPTNGAYFQQKVTSLDVLSNVGGIINGTGIATGSIEIWPSSYTATNSLPVPNASNATFDFGDGGASSTGGGYGSMQVHNYGPTATQTLFAVNNFNNNATLCIGIGNCTNPVTGGVDWTFNQNAAAYNLRRVLHVFVLPSNQVAAAEFTRPTIVRATGSQTLNQAVVTFSETVSDNAAVLSNFSLNNGVTITGATLLPGKKDVLLTTTAQAAGATYTVTVTGVRDRSPSGNLILPGSTATFMAPTAPAPSVLTNVAETASYQLIHQLAITDTTSYANGAPYTIDESKFARSLPFDRVAYCLELVTNGVTKWVYVSMDAFTTDLTKIGVPTADRGGLFQQIVSNLNIYAYSSDGSVAVTTGVGIASGNIEFWPSNYNQANDKSIPGASASTYDFGDGGGPTATTAGHGSMQIHNFAAGHTIFSLSHFGSNGLNPALGIGNNPVWSNNDPDWTFTYNAKTYSTKNLYVLVHTGEPPATTQTSGTPPAISFQPNAVTLKIGQRATFSVVAAGATRYQWRRNGVWIDGATLPWLDISAASISNAGAYDVLVFGSGSAYTVSASARLNVISSATVFQIF